ncbi:transposase [Burkholderia ubonensis]|nr:transposase [Burkholderia ubonensis]OJB08693.1 transposase [Burkholderia ubonensis]
MHMQLCTIIKSRDHFPSDEVALKLIWLAPRDVLVKTLCAAFDWKPATNQSATLFGERFAQARG